MASLTRDRVGFTSQRLHPRENLFVTGNLGALNAEIIVDAHGCASVTLDVRNTFVGTLEVSGTVDGTNWTLIPLRGINTAAVAYVADVPNTLTPAIFIGPCSGFDRVRVRMSLYTSGTAICTLIASNSPIDQSLQGEVTTSIGTILGAVGADTTLTLAAPGAGLRHYLTMVFIARFNVALLAAGTVPVNTTSTNIPGPLALSFPAEAAPQGTLNAVREDFSYPLATTAQNTVTTITCPATPNVIWRITAGFYVAP